MGPTVEFLDFVLYKPVPFEGKIEYRPTLRDNGVLLAHTSAHMPKAHVEWPLNFIMRLRGRSSTLEMFEAAKQKFLQKLRSNNFSEEVIGYLKSETVFSNVTDHKLDSAHAKDLLKQAFRTDVQVKLAFCNHGQALKDSLVV